MSKKKADDLRNDVHLLVLQNLLALEDNKYCVDCDAKSPRWASWNIGVFLCIRCAGIHRKLGVHISRVKSVNLDTWTPEQLAYMKEMGNSRGRAIYEAQIPDGFQRPQIDSAVEQLIRGKYEMKRYIAHEYVPSRPDVEAMTREILHIEQLQKRKPTSSSSAVSLSKDPSNSQSSSSIKRPPSSNAQNTPTTAQQPVAASAQNDLIGLFDAPPKSALSEGTLFQIPQPQQQQQQQQQQSNVLNDLAGLSFGQDKPFANFEHQQQQQAAPSTKDSIMSLFEQPSQAAQFGSFASQNASTIPMFPLTGHHHQQLQQQQQPNLFQSTTTTTTPRIHSDLDGLFSVPAYPYQQQPPPPPVQNVGVFGMQPPHYQQHQQSAVGPDFLGDLNLFGKNPPSYSSVSSTNTSTVASAVNSAKASHAAPPCGVNGNFANFSSPQNAPGSGSAGEDFLASIQGQLSSLNMESGAVN